ncbi:hypothetical protein M942_24280 [Enterobacter ludwigii]|nr:hypothetical protein M942_24280 [Enterobacter ludwigii]
MHHLLHYSHHLYDYFLRLMKMKLWSMSWMMEMNVNNRKGNVFCSEEHKSTDIHTPSADQHATTTNNIISACSWFSINKNTC